MSERKYYCICESNCKFETLTKEQIYTLIAEVVNNGKFPDSIDTGFVTKIKAINSGRYVTFWIGTQAQYNALTERAENCLYIITDSTEKHDLLEFRYQLEHEVSNNAFVAQSAYEIAAAAAETANEAKEKANTAIAARMVREFTSGILSEATSYTTPGSKSKLYVVTLAYVDVEQYIPSFSVTLEWQTIKEWTDDGMGYFVYADFANRVGVGAKVNEDNTVTFTAAEPKNGDVQRVYIQNVVGFY